MFDHAFSPNGLEKARHVKPLSTCRNFRDEVTVNELEDLADELDVDLIWTPDRIVVCEASDRRGRRPLTPPLVRFEEARVWEQRCPN